MRWIGVILLIGLLTMVGYGPSGLADQGQGFKVSRNLTNFKDLAAYGDDYFLYNESIVLSRRKTGGDCGNLTYQESDFSNFEGGLLRIELRNTSPRVKVGAIKFEAYDDTNYRAGWVVDGAKFRVLDIHNAYSPGKYSSNTKVYQINPREGKRTGVWQDFVHRFSNVPYSIFPNSDVYESYGQWPTANADYIDIWACEHDTVELRKIEIQFVKCRNAMCSDAVLNGTPLVIEIGSKY